jgi:hypothetical protein
MRLANKSCVHNCGRYILSSVLDMGQHTNIKQVGEFCLKNVVKPKFKDLGDLQGDFSEILNRKQIG